MILSLKKWPNIPFLQAHYSLSPLTEKVLKSSGILLKQILPISFAEFCLEMGLDKKSQSLHRQLFDEYNDRRRKKIELLKSIRQDYAKDTKNELKVNHSGPSKMLKSITRFSGKSLTNRSNSVKQVNLRNRKKKRKEVISKTKIKSTDKTEAYFNYYTSSKKRGTRFLSKKKQSHLKKQKNLTPQQILNEDYFTQKSIKTQRIDRSTKDDLRDFLMVEISQALNKWVQIDSIHAKQVQEFEDLNDKQKRRLKKIHFIEREQLREEIKNLKTKLSYTQNLITG